jgi:hypothetical protein
MASISGQRDAAARSPLSRAAGAWSRSSRRINRRVSHPDRRFLCSGITREEPNEQPLATPCAAQERREGHAEIVDRSGHRVRSTRTTSAARRPTTRSNHRARSRKQMESGVDPAKSRPRSLCRIRATRGDLERAQGVLEGGGEPNPSQGRERPQRLSKGLEGDEQDHVGCSSYSGASWSGGRPKA